MSITGNIRKILFISAWSVIGAGVLVLLIAAINHRNTRRCSGYTIDITNKSGSIFIDRTEISKLLSRNTGALKGKPVTEINLSGLEDSIKTNPWIKDAQLYFDHNEMLHVNINGREPAARIFTALGSSFYIDSAAYQLPLSSRGHAEVPVFTGYPSEKISRTGADSALTFQVKNLCQFLAHDSFWMAQVQQVDILPGGRFELVPLVGSHLIDLGNADGLDKKFSKLFIFYKDVLQKVGFNKYRKIDLQFEGQVVATRNGGNIPKVDSIQAVKNIEQLIKAARAMETDTLHQRNMKQLEDSNPNVQDPGGYDMIPPSADSVANRSVSHPVANNKTMKQATLQGAGKKPAPQAKPHHHP